MRQLDIYSKTIHKNNYQILSQHGIRKLDVCATLTRLNISIRNSVDASIKHTIDYAFHDKNAQQLMNHVSHISEIKNHVLFSLI